MASGHVGMHLGFGRATLPMAIPRGVRKEPGDGVPTGGMLRGGGGVQPLAGFKEEEGGVCMTQLLSPEPKWGSWVLCPPKSGFGGTHGCH